MRPQSPSRKNGCDRTSRPMRSRMPFMRMLMLSCRNSVQSDQRQTCTVEYLSWPYCLILTDAAIPSHPAYDDGRTQLLLCLHGLLPIAYRGTSYNIPIALWLSRDYPRQPPITYVVPTSDMLVRSSKFVDVSGRCSLDYLQNWERKSEVGCYHPLTDYSADFHRICDEIN